MDLAALRARLVEARTLLEQAAALGAVQDAEKVRAMSNLQQHKHSEEQGVHPRRKRFR